MNVKCAVFGWGGTSYTNDIGTGFNYGLYGGNRDHWKTNHMWLEVIYLYNIVLENKYKSM